MPTCRAGRRERREVHQRNAGRRPRLTPGKAIQSGGCRRGERHLSRRGCSVMDRRAFMFSVAGSLLIAPLDTLAQQPTKIWRIGYLRRTSREPADIEALRLGLRELGYVEGQNLVIDERYANGDAARLPDLARELMQLKVQVLV